MWKYSLTLLCNTLFILHESRRRSSTIIYPCHTHRRICSSGLWHRDCSKGVQECGVVLLVGSSYQVLICFATELKETWCRNMLKTRDTSCSIHTDGISQLLLPLSQWKPETGISCLEKRARLSVPHLPHFLWPQTHTALRNSCIHGSAQCVRAFWELALERWWYCGPRVRGAGRGSAGDPALPGWGKSGRGQSHLLLLCRLVWWLTGLSTFRLHFCFVTVDEFIGWVTSLNNFTELTADKF